MKSFNKKNKTEKDCKEEEWYIPTLQVDLAVDS